MTYAERLAEFVRVTGHKPGEMNKRRRCPVPVVLEYNRGSVVKPCALPAGHEGGHLA